MKIKLFLGGVVLAVLVLYTGCTKAVKVEHPTVPSTKPSPSPEKIEKSEITVPQIDFNKLQLEVTGIQQLIKKSSSFNSYNPKFSLNEKYVAFEANQNNLKTIFIYRLNAKVGVDGRIAINPQKVREVTLTQTSQTVSIEDLLENSSQESFNYEFSWFPNNNTYIFTSNAGVGEYNIFLGSVIPSDPLLNQISTIFKPKKIGEYLMLTEEVRKDGQAKVSPDGTKIVFTSGRTGNGDLYLIDIPKGELRRLTFSEDTDLFPEWSPDGKDIVFTTGGKHAHDIHVIRNIGTDNEHEEVLIKWFFDDVLPSYSPDGKYISFYTTYNKERDPFNTKRWGLMIIPADGSAPKAGKELVQYFHVSDIIKDNDESTAWFPDNTHIIFAKNIDSDYNPIYIYNVKTRKVKLIETETNINHDLTVSRHGLVAFRAQSFGWDRIFIAYTTFFENYVKTIMKGKMGVQ